jgi:hypothetical protein
MHHPGNVMPRECGLTSLVIARSEATKQSSVPVLTFVSCCSDLVYECQNQRDTSKILILVRFRI